MVNQVMIRFFPAELYEDQTINLIDVLREEIGPVRYARFLVESNPKRDDTVGFVSFYNEQDNQECIRRMKHKLQLMLPKDEHYVQFVPNHDTNPKAFDEWPHTQVRIYDLKDEIIKFAMVHMDKTSKERRKEERVEGPRYLEKTENKVIRVWEGIIKKKDRAGVGYNRAELAKNEARRLLLDELCQLDKSYKSYRSNMIDWSLFRIQEEIESAKKRNERKREHDEDEWFKDEWGRF
ncbi:unnamed protein product [Brachionus calyciflorus]|uniref:RRM domain-containing protein n=1 Tax=Brachionus calyciflorus TaxID=104777 RepID=A0A814M710_9BILA|nr:unnamed protein product [Brachionus calyciflorus]